MSRFSRDEAGHISNGVQYKLTIAYDGTNYAGWQIQPSEPTVQQMLEAAIEKVTGAHSSTLASGRTDAGVHALGQVVGFRTESKLPPEVLVRALNANLPNDIAVLHVAEAPEGFRPTHDAKRKRYRYVIHDGPVRNVFMRRFVWHYNYGRLDVDAMRRAAAALVGKHDFSSFESSGAERVSSVRTVFDLSVERGRLEGWVVPGTIEDKSAGQDVGHSLTYAGQGRAGESDFVTIEIEADGFLYNMVRAIVGTLVQVGRGSQAESWPGEVLRAADRSAAGPTAPAQGLCLMWVDYGSHRRAAGV